MDKAFQQLKDAITSEPVLIMYNPTKPIKIKTDSSNFAIGGVIGHREGKILRPIAFFSRKLHSAELNYPIYNKEFMAIIKAFKEWRHYCIGNMHKVKIHTDHRNIVFFAKTQRLSARQTCYFELLSDFDYEIIHCKGTQNRRADALSRKEEYYEDIPQLEA
jgi:hypothetical protein